MWADPVFNREGGYQYLKHLTKLTLQHNQSNPKTAAGPKNWLWLKRLQASPPIPIGLTREAW
jgi:hypothetical protein